METNKNICRLCRRQSPHLESLKGIREGLPLSVIIMVICPIKIEPKDSLPRFICGDCMQVVLSAYKLREESIESDRFFREYINAKEFAEDSEEEEDEEEQPVSIKDEPTDYFADPLPTINTQPARKKQLQPRDYTNVNFPFKVECHKKGKMKSSAWDYFGRLVDADGEVVYSEMGFYFCKMCVEEKKTIKGRYKGDSISTGMIFKHLMNAHGIGKEISRFDADDVKPFTAADAKAPAIQGLTFTCAAVGCNKVFKLKICLDIHQGLEHTEQAVEANSEFHVDTTQSKDLKSMAWSYFGALLDSNYEVIDDSHNYCRLCVGVGNLTKYLKSCSTSTLLHHIRDQHLQNKKRKRFAGSDTSPVTAYKIAKG